jgi:hypothetical protein
MSFNALNFVVETWIILCACVDFCGLLSITYCSRSIACYGRFFAQTQCLQNWPCAQICGQTIGKLIEVDDMHQRKAEMARLADAFIALPGTCLAVFNGHHLIFGSFFNTAKSEQNTVQFMYRILVWNSSF